jgi:hypothetical protein
VLLRAFQHNGPAQRHGCDRMSRLRRPRVAMFAHLKGRVGVGGILCCVRKPEVADCGQVREDITQQYLQDSRMGSIQMFRCSTLWPRMLSQSACWLS